MSFPLPANASTFRVVGRLVKSVADSSDPNEKSEIAPISGIKVFFSPSLNPPKIRFLDDTDPMIIFQETIEAVTDEEGYLKVASDPDNLGVELLYGFSENITPRGWSWDVTIRVGGNFPDDKFSIVGSDGGEVDLATVIRVPRVLGNDLMYWVDAVNNANAARDAAISAADRSEDSAQRSKQYAQDAENFKNYAAGSAAIAAQASETILDQIDNATTAETNAKASADSARVIANEASAYASEAADFADAAEESKKASADSALEALESRNEAVPAAQLATTKAGEANNSAIQAAEERLAAAGFATSATNSQIAAATSATAAQTARTGAETARTGAEAARTGAEAARDLALAGQFVGTVLLSSAHLDDQQTPGIFRSPNVANIGTDKGYPVLLPGLLEVLQAGPAGYGLIQRYTSVSGTDARRGIWFRRKYGNAASWQSWSFISAQRVDQTAGRAIYTWDDVNNREQLIYGDTGWRDISALIDPAAFSAASSVSVRRIGGIVYWNINLINIVPIQANTSVSILTGSLPAGFGSTLGETPDQPLVIRYYPNVQAWLFSRLRPAAPALRIENTALAASSTSRGLGVFTTSDTWPTTLPGTAVGSIPNV